MRNPLLLASNFLILYSCSMNIVLMAGGGGTRLWPISRSDKPKQFLDFGTGASLIEHTWRRAKAVTDTSNIYVATTQQYAAQGREVLPQLDDQHIFIEAERRDTGPAIAAVAAHLAARGQGQEPVIFMWSDHYFTAEDKFIADLLRLPDLIHQHPNHIIIVGHRPTSPETTLGYIELGELVEPGVYAVKAFKEKPNEATATTYLAAGNFVWNMGYVSSTPDYLLKELSVHEPALTAGIAALVAAPDDESARAAYRALPRLAIDYALLERTPRLLAVVGDYGWSDVGSWNAVKEVFGHAGDHVPNGHHIHVDSHNNYIYNVTDKTVSLLGLRDTITVVTDDAVLIASTKQAHRVKEIVSRLEKGHRHDLL